jgi:hypothetical protein
VGVARPNQRWPWAVKLSDYYYYVILICEVYMCFMWYQDHQSWEGTCIFVSFSKLSIEARSASYFVHFKSTMLKLSSTVVLADKSYSHMLFVWNKLQIRWGSGLGEGEGGRRWEGEGWRRPPGEGEGGRGGRASGRGCEDREREREWRIERGEGEGAEAMVDRVGGRKRT